jgi:hypothetical protein
VFRQNLLRAAPLRNENTEKDRQAVEQRQATLAHDPEGSVRKVADDLGSTALQIGALQASRGQDPRRPDRKACQRHQRTDQRRSGRDPRRHRHDRGSRQRSRRSAASPRKSRPPFRSSSRPPPRAPAACQRPPRGRKRISHNIGTVAIAANEAGDKAVEL